MNNKTTNNNSYSNTNQNFYKNTKNSENDIKKRIIKINIIYKKNLNNLEKQKKSKTSIENETESTEIEIYNTETIGNLIKTYCNNKKIKVSNNLYLEKKNLKKIKNNLTINEAKIENNETLYILEKNNSDKSDNNNSNDDNEYNDNEIFFNINYEGKNYSFSGFEDNTFINCIKSFIEEKGEKNFFFIFNGNIIDKNKTLNELKIKNEDVIRIGEIK